MDTINFRINRQFSYLPAYKWCQNASIWARMVEKIKFNFEYDYFQSIPIIEELQYYTAKSKYHSYTQLNVAIQETLNIFNKGEFNAGRCRIESVLNERKTLSLIIDNLDKFHVDILDEFIESSSDWLQRDFTWLPKDSAYWDVTRDKGPKIKYTGSTKELHNRLVYHNSLIFYTL